MSHQDSLFSQSICPECECFEELQDCCGKCEDCCDCSDEKEEEEDE